jgi:hypothetical protein
MADSFTLRNRGRKPESGQHANAWAALANEDLISDRMDEALDGVESYTLSGSKTLTSSPNGETDEARMRVQNITGGTGGTVTIPSVQKWYLVRNGASGSAIFTTGSGATGTVGAGLITVLFCDGTNVYAMSLAAYVASALAAVTAAETAQAAAETAETNAETAATNAANSATAAATAETNAETAEANAEAAQAAAEAARDAAQAAALPDQTGHNGKFVKTDGTDASWELVTLADISDFSAIGLALAEAADEETARAAIDAQEALVSGTNIKTINGASLLGSGDIAVSSEWTQIATSTPSGVATVSLTSIPSTYQDLLLVFTGLSGTASANITVSASGDNDSTRCTIGSIFVGGGSDTLYGHIAILGYRKAAGSVAGRVGNLSSDTSSEGGTSNNVHSWRIAAGVNALRLALSSGTFDAGTITLFGK